MGPKETSISAPNHAVLHAQNHRSGLGPIEIWNSDPKVAFCKQQPQMRAGTHRDLQFWC